MQYSIWCASTVLMSKVFKGKFLKKKKKKKKNHWYPVPPILKTLVSFILTGPYVTKQLEANQLPLNETVLLISQSVAFHSMKSPKESSLQRHKRDEKLPFCGLKNPYWNQKEMPSSILGRNSVPFKTSADLGVHLDRTLSMQQHISSVCHASILELRQITSIRLYLSESAAARLVAAMVISCFDYCNSVFTGLPADQIARLYRVQNNAAQLVMKKENETT